ncbi:MAG: hypothetical protein WC528_05450 [Patescibacteria group bacterium]
MAENLAAKTTKYILKELVFDVVYFPVWWYTAGLKKAGLFFVNEVLSWSNRLSLKILFMNLLKPMYGDYSRSGRIISFFLRIIVFFYKLVLMVIWLAILLVLLLLWLVLPVFIVYMIILNLSGQRGLF